MNTMLKRESTSTKRHETNWFMFSGSLYVKICSDYFALRLLFYLEPLTTLLTTLQLMIEIAEKSLKLFVIVKTQSETALKDAESYGHNIEKLRKACALLEPLFNDSDIQEFTKYLDNGTVFQHVRYGTERTNSGISGDLGKMLPVIDKIFFKSTMLMPKHVQRMLGNNFIKFLLENNQFSQSKNPQLLLEALSNNNLYLDEYVLNYKRLEEEFEIELKKLEI